MNAHGVYRYGFGYYVSASRRYPWFVLHEEYEIEPVSGSVLADTSKVVRIISGCLLDLSVDRRPHSRVAWPGEVASIHLIHCSPR